jgi:hypothetical protein
MSLKRINEVEDVLSLNKEMYDLLAKVFCIRCGSKKDIKGTVFFHKLKDCTVALKCNSCGEILTSQTPYSHFAFEVDQIKAIMPLLEELHLKCIDKKHSEQLCY